MFPKWNRDLNFSQSLALSTYDTSLLGDTLLKQLGDLLGTDRKVETMEEILNILSETSWVSNEKMHELLKPVLMQLCADYLYNVKHRGFAINSVANFHFRNGATLWRLNWLGDTSARGLANSFGLMVNYRYFLENTEENSQNYIGKQQIAVDNQVLQFLTKTKSSL